MSEIFEKVAELREKILSDLKEVKDELSLKSFQETHMSKKSALSQLMGEIRNLVGEEKTRFGQAMNEARNAVQTAFQAKQKEIQEKVIAAKLEREKIDITLPSYNYKLGGINPFYLIQDEIIDTFVSMGYEVKEGPDVETDYYNFERMNIPADHPAREMQDSLYINPTTLLRTHTSPEQAHAMDEKGGKPLMMICPGKTYRRDDDDATHSHQFGQVEGLVVGKGITMANLKATLELFVRRMFGP